MSNPNALGSICYEAESSFGENTGTAATLRLPQLSSVDTSGLTHAKSNAERVVQHLNACDGYVLGTMGGSVKTKTYLTGHGSATSGATSATTYETWLSLFWGNGAVSAASGTTFTGGGTATAPTTTASGTFTPGSIGWAGLLGDARGNGQPFVVGTHAATTLNLLTALGAIPSAADICASGYTMYLPETTFACTSQRLLLQGYNAEYLCHGCHPTAVTISGLEPGGKPTIEITWAVAWWEYKTTAMPSTVATNTDNPATTAAGSIFVNDVGTATRSLRTARNFSINIELGMATLRGPGGVNQYQDIVGCRRLPSKISISWTEDAEATTLTPAIPAMGTSTTNKHILYGNGGPPGQRVAIYAPNVVSKVVAIQKNENGINSFTYEGHCDVGTTTTSDLTLSAARVAFG